MGSWGLVPVFVAAGLVLGGCTKAQSVGEVDRRVEAMAVDIGWPRQYSAEGFARAALATPMGKGSGFTVLEVTDLDAAALDDPIAHLVIRVHSDGGQTMWGEIEPLTVCYALDFNRYGIIDHPSQVGCPEGARPITYPPAVAWADAAAFEAALADLLSRLPAAPSAQRVENALYGSGLLKAEEMVDDINTNLGPDDPRPAVRVQGGDVFVAITAGPECLLGSRQGGKVTTSRPPVAECVP
jgi:hypothetical protein